MVILTTFHILFAWNNDGGGNDQSDDFNAFVFSSDNVPVVERVACKMRAQVAGAAVAGGI